MMNLVEHFRDAQRIYGFDAVHSTAYNIMDSTLSDMRIHDWTFPV